MGTKTTMADRPHQEIWLEAPDGQVLAALVNGERGWLMYLRHPGDTGFSSRNPHYAGPAAATVEYILSNGQRDTYPAAWALPRAEVERALAWFRERHLPPPFITWHNDSGDGAAISAPLPAAD